MLVLGLGAQADEAHAELISSDPVAGSVLATPPSVVRMLFNEEIAPQASSANLVDADGDRVPGTLALVEPNDPTALTLDLPPLSNGGYGVLWQVLAQDDGHTTSGVLVF